MENQLSQLFQFLVKGIVNPAEDLNVEFKVCYDMCSFKSDTIDAITALSNDMYRMVLYLYYTRLFIHTNAYFQQYLVDNSLDKDKVLAFLASFLDIIFSICKIVNYDPYVFDFYTVMSLDLELLKSFAGSEEIDVFNMTGFLSYSIILLEDKVNWKLIQDGVNDWQGAREEVAILFVILAIIARLMDVSYKDLCSFFILTRSQVK